MPIEKTKVSMVKGGTVERTPVYELFRNIYQERSTARLLISYRGEERTFLFDRGQLHSASSNREAQLVGELMRTFGLADESLLLAAFERALAEPGRGLGRALTESGAVAPFIADATVRSLAERILFDTYRWTSGAFTITPLEEVSDLPMTFDRPLGTLALEALRRLPAGRPQGPAIDPFSRPILSPALLLRFQALSLTADEANVLAGIDGERTAERIGANALSPLSRLAAVGLVEMIGSGRTLEQPSVPEGLLFLNVEIGGAAPLVRAAEAADNQRSTVWNTYRRVDWATLYEVLGVERDTELELVQRAVPERARLFHPDNVFKSHLADARDALEALFQKVCIAERAFHSSGSRESYDRSLDSGADNVALPGTAPTPEVQKEIAKANYTRAKILYDQEDYHPAYAMVRQSVEFDPDQKDYWVLLSRIQRKNPKWLRQSSETMRRAVARIPAQVDLLWELSEAYLAERNEIERVKTLREILKIDPANRRAQGALASLGSRSQAAG